VDDPHEPPCVRCRRESKECFFSATRRKRKADSADDGLGDVEGAFDGFATRVGRGRSARAHESVDEVPVTARHKRRSTDSGSLSATSPVGGYNLAHQSHFQQPHLYPKPSAINGAEVVQDQEVTNETAAALFQSPINTPGDALHLLLRASGQSEEIQQRDSSDQIGHHRNAESQLRPTTLGQSQTKSTGTRQQSQYLHAANIDPAITGNGSESGQASSFKETLIVWSRLRFVRAGWFTAREAMSFVD